MKTAEKQTSIFRNRNFSLVFFGSFVSDLGAVLYSFAVGFYILEISSHNAFLQGVYLAVCGVMMLVFTPLGGVLGDRFSKARIMFICDFLKGGSILLAALGMILLPSYTAHIAILFITGIIGNAVSGIFSPAAGALLPYIVEESRLQQANAYYSIKNSLQSIFGVVLAGILYTALPVTALFSVVGVCYIFSGISEMFIRYNFEKPDNKLTVASVFSDMREGFEYLKGQRAVIVLMVSILFINFFLTPVFSNFVPYFIKTDIAEADSYLFDSFMKPELWSSVLSMLVGISSLAGAMYLSMHQEEGKCGMKIALRLGVMAACMSTLAISYWLLVDRGFSLNAFLVLMCFLTIVMGSVIPFVNIKINTLIMKIVDKNQLSKVNSIISLISQGLIPFASVMAGAVLQFWGTTILLFICAAGFVVSAIYLARQPETRTF
ncbi:MAG: MFS transporter [Solobacterium sp.]|nr:MFS transporter [Solobacterium sp.]